MSGDSTLGGTTTATPPRSAPARSASTGPTASVRGAGTKRPQKAHHWTYPSEERTTADHLTGFRRFCHDLITWATWFVHKGGAPQILTELFPTFFAGLLERPAGSEPRRVGRARRVMQ